MKGIRRGVVDVDGGLCAEKSRGSGQGRIFPPTPPKVVPKIESVKHQRASPDQDFEDIRATHRYHCSYIIECLRVWIEKFIFLELGSICSIQQRYFRPVWTDQTIPFPRRPI